MKHIKKFNELNRSTYLSASNKLRDKGHINRSLNLRDHASNISSEDEFTFYRVSMPQWTKEDFLKNILVSKIKDIVLLKIPEKITSTDYSKTNNRSLIDKISGRNKEGVVSSSTLFNNVSIKVTFDNGEVYLKNVGKEDEINDTTYLQAELPEFGDAFFGGSDSRERERMGIIFTRRKDALKFVKICNDKIKEFTGEKRFLNVNDYYKD